MSLRLPLAALLGLLAGSVHAQTAPIPPQEFALQTFEPAPAGDGFFAVPDAAFPGSGVPAVGLVISGAADPLTLRLNGETIPGGTIVHRQVWAFAQASVGVGDRLLLDLAVPVALYQSGSAPFPGMAEVASSGVGDFKLGARLALGRALGAAFALGGELWLPTGSPDAFMSDGTARAQLKLVASRTFGPLDVSADLGALYRKSLDAGYTTVGPALTYGAGAAWRLGDFRVGPELFGRWQFEGTAVSPLEALLGAHWRSGRLDAGLGVGTGLNLAPGAAPLRILARLTWWPDPTDPAAAAEAKAYAAARAEVEAAAAAQQAEAARAAADRAAADRAASERAEAARLAGAAAAATAVVAAPAPDRDADGIPDPADACPEQAGVASSDAARHGCPSAPTTALVALTKDRIQILQAVAFEPGKAVLLPESAELLRQVAAVLAAHPELTAVRVEGHTDSSGAEESNLKLSRRRAEAVKAWLVQPGGIDAGRLEAAGYGSRRPLAPNDSATGRAKNRRVEFHILGP